MSNLRKPYYHPPHILLAEYLISIRHFTRINEMELKVKYQYSKGYNFVLSINKNTKISTNSTVDIFLQTRYSKRYAHKSRDPSITSELV